MIHDQPLDGGYFPPRYPGHGYTGEGVIVRVRVVDEVVGHLTRQGDAVGWDADAPPDTDAGIVRRIVSEALRIGAADGRPLDEVWAELLATVQHDEPYEGDLAALAT